MEYYDFLLEHYNVYVLIPLQFVLFGSLILIDVVNFYIYKLFDKSIIILL